MLTLSSGGRAGRKLLRIGSGHPVSFSAHVVAHAPCWRESVKPGGCTAFRSHSNSNMLTHPARGAGPALQFATAQFPTYFEPWVEVNEPRSAMSCCAAICSLPPLLPLPPLSSLSSLPPLSSLSSLPPLPYLPSALCSLPSALYYLSSALCALLSALCPLLSALSAPCPRPVALCSLLPLPCVLCPLSSTLCPLPSALGSRLSAPRRWRDESLQYSLPSARSILADSQRIMDLFQHASEFEGLGSYTWNQQPYNATYAKAVGFKTNWDLSGTFMVGPPLVLLLPSPCAFTALP